MESLEALVHSAQELSHTEPSPAQLQAALTQLRQAEESLFPRQAASLPDVLTVLDPQKHTLHWLFILDALLALPNYPVDRDKFLSTAFNFLTVCTKEHIRLAPAKLASICHAFTDQCIAARDPMRGILVVESCLRKLQPGPEHLTPMHGDLFKLCLLARNYRAALPVLKNQVLEVDPAATGIVPRDFLLYCYYGGMLWIGLKDYEKATELLHHAITAPATALSAVAIAANKKYILICLITRGSVPSTPKYAVTAIQRSLRNACNDYMSLATAYGQRNVTDLLNSVRQHSAAFNADNNMGLVKQCVESLYRRNIQRLTQTYLTLALSDIAATSKLANAAEAERRLLGIIKDGEIFAVINQKDGMISFAEDPEQYVTWDMTDQLGRDISSLMRVTEKVVATEEQISVDNAYITKTLKDRPMRWAEHEEFVMGSGWDS